jgi:TRAP-type mannitol/chloroaromatic compound transport system substrate-binding protein
MQIYWGAVPFVLIQIIMVGLVIAFPGMLAAGAAPAVHAPPTSAGASLPASRSRWTPSTAPPKSSPRKVGEMTGGKFRSRTHAGGELMPAFGVVDGVQNGTVEMAHTAPYYFFGKDPTFAWAAPFPSA